MRVELSWEHTHFAIQPIVLEAARAKKSSRHTYLSKHGAFFHGDHVWFVSIAYRLFGICWELGVKYIPYIPVVPHKAVAEVSKIGNL